MDQIKQLSALRHLAEAKRDADVAILERLRNEVRALEMQVDQLEDAALEGVVSGETPSAFQVSGRDAVWDRWRVARVRELMQQIARVRADIEGQRVEAGRSVGKHQVIQKLLERHK